MILPDYAIEMRNILTPTLPRTKWTDPEGREFTFGLGPATYDVRVEFDTNGSIPFVIFAPGQCRLASTMEYFTMPKDVAAVVHDKSSWARRFLTVQNTFIDPGWEGYLTLELINHSYEAITLYRETPIAQIEFKQLVGTPKILYSGKYHKQERGPQRAR